MRLKRKRSLEKRSACMRLNPCRSQSGLATWIKALVCLFVASLLLFGMIVLCSYNFINGVSKELVDPRRIQRVAAAIADFEEPLPAEFQLMSALEVPGQSTLAIHHSTTGMTLILQRLAGPTSRRSEDEVRTITNMTLNIDKQRSGTLEVAGKTMPYVIGTSIVDPKSERLMGLMALNERNCVISLTAEPVEGRQVDMETVRRFLSLIKSFK